MLTKLYTMLEEREEGFTLIELLVVILIIGILAAIAIPVFLNQRQTANDGAVESDVKNAATAVETWNVSQRGSSIPVDMATLAASGNEVKVSEGVTLTITGTNTEGFCITGYHENGKEYVSTTEALTYDSVAGGLGKTGGACPASGGTTTPTPAPTTETPVASGQTITAFHTGGGTSINGTLNLTKNADGSLAGIFTKADGTSVAPDTFGITIASWTCVDGSTGGAEDPNGPRISTGSWTNSGNDAITTIGSGNFGCDVSSITLKQYDPMYSMGTTYAPQGTQTFTF